MVQVIEPEIAGEFPNVLQSKTVVSNVNETATIHNDYEKIYYSFPHCCKISFIYL